jgi:hypothetical protein
MTRSPNRRLRGLSVGVLLVGVAGATHCTGASSVTPGPYSTPVDTSRYGRVLGERKREEVGVRPLPPNLGGPFQSPVAAEAPLRETPAPAKKIDVMTESELVAYLNTLVYDMSLDHSELALLACRKPGGRACPLDSLASVYIQPEVGMNRRAWDRIPANGMVVARLINYSASSDTESTIGLPPAQRAWWYVDKVAGNTYRSRYFVRTYAASGPAVQFLATKTWEECKYHAPVSNRPAIAKCRGCNYEGGPASQIKRAEAVDARAFIRALSFAPWRAARSAARPAVAAISWITCDLGCCVGA